MVERLTGRFLLGVKYQGKLHYDFSVGILTVGGECEALEWLESQSISLDSPKKADQMLIDMAYLAQQIQIDGVPKEKMTAHFLLNNLATDDYVLAQAQIAELRKKRSGVGDSPLPADSQ